MWAAKDETTEICEEIFRSAGDSPLKRSRSREGEKKKNKESVEPGDGAV